MVAWAKVNNAIVLNEFDLAPHEIAVIEALFPTFTPAVIGQAPDADKPAPAHVLASIGDRAGRGIDGAIVTFEPDATGAQSLLEGISVPGGYGLWLLQDMRGRLDVQRDHDPASDGDISVSDALDALRLAVGLAPSFGPAAPFDLSAADIDRDGEVSVGDALDILRAAVGLVAEEAPRWVFVDDAQNFSGMDDNTVTYATGRDVDTAAGDAPLEMTGILLSHVDSVA